jgi:hypothetical protein
MLGYGLELNGWEGSMADSCKHGSESSGSIKCRESLDQMSFSRIPWSHHILTYNVWFALHTYHHATPNTSRHI